MLHQLQMKWRNNSSFPRVQNAMKQLQKSFLHLIKRATRECNTFGTVASMGNVKKGHFSVLTLGNGELKKVMVALRYLAHPPFIKLLEAAELEFGFDQKGVLVVTCDARELQEILLLKKTSYE